MESLKLNHLTEKEIANVNGGYLALAVATYLAVEIAGNPKAHAEAFKKGFEAGI